MKTRRRPSPGAKPISTCSAAQGYSPAPNWPDRAWWFMAAGLASEPLRPRKERRAPLGGTRAPLGGGEAAPPADSLLVGVGGRAAPPPPSRSVLTCPGLPHRRGAPRHSLLAEQV